MSHVVRAAPAHVKSCARFRAHALAALSRSGSLRSITTFDASSRAAPLGTRNSDGSIIGGPGASYASTGSDAASISRTPNPNPSIYDGKIPSEQSRNRPGSASGSKSHTTSMFGRTLGGKNWRISFSLRFRAPRRRNWHVGIVFPYSLHDLRKVTRALARIERPDKRDARLSGGRSTSGFEARQPGFSKA